MKKTVVNPSKNSSGTSNGILDSKKTTDSAITPKKLIVVLGMHRSGTSVVARGLKVLGVELGENLLPPMAEVNEKGFWEDVDVNALNTEILNAVGNGWHQLSVIRAKDLQLLRDKGYIQRAVELLRQKTANIQIFGFKDPRVAKLILFWKEVFNFLGWEVDYVLSIRNPLSVVKSLAKRDGFDAEMSYLLWLSHVVLSLVGTVGENRILVDYDFLMQAPRAELHRIANTFGLCVDETMMDVYLQEFLDLNLQHTRYTVNDLLQDDKCPQLVFEIYALLSECAFDKIRLEDGHLEAEFNRWYKVFESFSAPMRLADNLYRKISTIDQKLAECYQHLQALGEEYAYAQKIVSERDNQIKQLNDQLKTLGEQYGYAQTIVVERDLQLQAINGELQSQGREYQAAQAIVAERDLQLQMLNDQLQIQGKECHHAQVVVSERDLQLQMLNDQLQLLGKENEHTQKIVAERDMQLKILNVQLQAIGEEHSHAQNIVAERDMQLGNLNAQLQALGNEHSHAQKIVAERDMQLAERDQQLGDLANKLAVFKKIKKFLRIK